MVVLQPPMIGPPSTITPPETTRRRKRSRTEEDGLQRPFEEDAFKENGTFTPAVLLLFQNGDGTVYALNDPSMIRSCASFHLFLAWSGVLSQTITLKMHS